MFIGGFRRKLNKGSPLLSGQGPGNQDLRLWVQSLTIFSTLDCKKMNKVPPIKGIVISSDSNKGDYHE